MKANEWELDSLEFEVNDLLGGYNRLLHQSSYQISISAQQPPYGPTPALLSLVEGFHPSTLA